MSYKIIKYKNKTPVIEKDVFIADGVKLIGDVQIDKQTSVWYNSVIRGDVNYVKIGKRQIYKMGQLFMFHRMVFQQKVKKVSHCYW